MTDLDNAMRRQVFSLPELIKAQYDDLEPKTRKALTTPETFSLQKIVLTGAGDSYAASLAAKPVFEKMTGLPVEVVTAVDLARFYEQKQLGFAPHNPLVIAVSNSGTGARVSEAVQRAVKHGAFVLAVTGNQDSPLAAFSSKIVKLDIPPFESAPGTRSYAAALLSLLLLAIRFGEVRGRYTMDRAMEYRRDICSQAEALQSCLAEMDAAMKSLAERWRHLEAWDFIGAGQDYATAWFGHAKIFEATGQYAMHINTEEWHHLNFFMRNAPKIATVLVCSTRNAAFSRARELAGYAQKLTRPLLIVSDGALSDFGDVKGEFVWVPASAREESLPLFQFVPLCLLAGYMMKLTGEKDGRGCEGLWAFAAGGESVKNSTIVIL